MASRSSDRAPDDLRRAPTRCRATRETRAALFAGAALAIAWLSIAIPAAQQPLAEADLAARAAGYEAAAERARTRLVTLRREANALSSREKGLLGELRALEIDRSLKEAEVERLEAELGAVVADLDRATLRIGDIERQVASERPAIAAHLERLYRFGPRPAPRAFASVSSVREAGRVWRALSSLAARDDRRLAGYRSQLEALRTEQARLETRQRQVVELRATADAARRAAVSAAEAQAARVASIASRRELVTQLSAELETARANLETAVGALPADAAALSLPLRPFQGDLDWPVRGRLVSRFGRERQSRFGTIVVRNGVEIDAQAGTAVRAIHEGRVAYADVFSGFGRLVIVDHGAGAFSLYGHLASVDVAKGDRLAQGATIGGVGRAPSGATALYFELRIDGRPVNPIQWLRP